MAKSQNKSEKSATSLEGVVHANTLTELPAVARSFVQECKKCGEDRLHKVIVHATADSAKVECEICHKKSTFKLKKAKKPKATPAEKKEATKVREAAAASAANLELWTSMKKKHGGKASKPYRISEKFEKDGIVEHPKFGLGFVVQCTDNRIETVFEEGLKILVHNHK